MKKMNNKGFSLVELIVVVLIMAIIAVALAPQVMKWVENSRQATDRDTYEQFISNLQIALTDKSLGATVDATVFHITNDGVGIDNTTAISAAPNTALGNALTAVAADWWKAKMKSSSNTDVQISVSTNKMITRTAEPIGNADLS